MRGWSFGARCAIAALVIAACLSFMAPTSAVADDGATGSFQVLSVQNGIMHLSISVTPGSGACESVLGVSVCDWYAFVDVESAPGGNCQLYATSDPSGSLSSQANADPQTAEEPLVTQVASGQCMLTLRYNDLSGSGQVLAQQPYTFPSPNASFTAVSGNTSSPGPFLLATASVTLSEPICPSDGACSWFGFVVAEPASTGCPAAVDPGYGPTAVWVGQVLDGPGTESASVSQVWNTAAGPLLWCGYIDGPGAPGAGAGLFGQATYTPPSLPAAPSPSSPAPTPTPKPKYTRRSRTSAPGRSRRCSTSSTAAADARSSRPSGRAGARS